MPPPLPAPRSQHALAAFDDGRVVVAGGFNVNGPDLMLQLMKQAVQWVPGSAAWAALPAMAEKRFGAVAVALPDGRLLVAGGVAGHTCHASAEVLSADGSGWAAVAAMPGPRAFAAAGLLPSGWVIVAGGCSGPGAAALATVEQWDPVEDRWSVLPPMLHARTEAAGVVLADGRFAVFGGIGADGKFRWDGEVVDSATGRWESLPWNMAVTRANFGLAAVAGGMIAIGGDQEAAAAELFDEESGRWLALPHPMAVSRDCSARVVPVPASALAPPATPAADAP